jgi:hypothetical protein
MTATRRTARWPLSPSVPAARRSGSVISSEPLDEVFLRVEACDGAAVVLTADEVTRPLIRLSCSAPDVPMTASAAEALACALLEAAQQVVEP